jgi:hypothetical protein
MIFGDFTFQQAQVFDCTAGLESGEEYTELVANTLKSNFILGYFLSDTRKAAGGVERYANFDELRAAFIMGQAFHAVVSKKK